MRHRHIVVGDRHQERPDAVGFFRIEVGASVEQLLGNVDVVVARGIEQRCHTTGRWFAAAAVFWRATTDETHAKTETRYRVGCNKGRCGANFGAGVGIGAVLE